LVANYDFTALDPSRPQQFDDSREHRRLDPQERRRGTVLQVRTAADLALLVQTPGRSLPWIA